MSYVQARPYENLVDLRDRARDEVGKVVVGQGHAVDLLLVAALAQGHVLIEGPREARRRCSDAPWRTCWARSSSASSLRPTRRPTRSPAATPSRWASRCSCPGSSSQTFCSPTRSTGRRLAPRPRCSRLCRSAPSLWRGRRTSCPTRSSSSRLRTRSSTEGIFPLPESQLDRFLFKIVLDYADAESEIEMLRLPHTGVTPDMLGDIQSLLGVVGLDRARSNLDLTTVPTDVATYIVGIVRHTRENPGLELGASSRAAIHLLSAAKAQARLGGRDHVTIDDVREGGSVRAAPPPDLPRGYERGRRAAGCSTGSPPRARRMQRRDREDIHSGSASARARAS